MQITEQDKHNLRLTEEDVKLVEAFDRRLSGEDVAVNGLKEFLGTPQAMNLIPKVVVGQVRKAAEPNYIATKLMKKIRMPNAQGVVIFPSVGVMRAFGPIAEGAETPEDTLDWQTHEGSHIRISKYGVRVRYSDELSTEATWDILSMLLDQAGRAMGRIKEEQAFHSWSSHGHVVFDNALYESDPVKYAEARTTGLDYAGLKNGTFSVEDWLDMIIAGYNNEMNPDLVLMHPLSWSAFTKTALYGGYNSIFQSPTFDQPKGGLGSVKIGPEAVSGRLPFPFSVQMSPFIPLDKINRRFDMYVVDSKNCGVLIEKESLTTEQWSEPARDLHNIKFRERYGLGAVLEGRGVMVARNVSLDAAMPIPTRIKQV